MSVLPPLNIQKWIEENKHLLKPPVGNKQIYSENNDFIVMIVGGPNSRKDYHYNHGEELFIQIKGDITLKIIEAGQHKNITIGEGDMFLLPPRTPHLPQRPSNTIGLVVERYRQKTELDAFMWFCEKCGNKLHEAQIHVSDIVKQLPEVMNNFYSNRELCTCKKCGHIMQKPDPLSDK